MRTKRLLVALPVLCFAVFAQAAFWVPTFESQAQGNPERLTTFFRGDIAGPKLLNPILSTETASFDIMANNVTEALVGTDENGKLVPRLAERWELTELAYLAVRPERTLPDGQRVDATGLLAVIRAAADRGELGGIEKSIGSLRVVPSERRALSETVLVDNEHGKKTPMAVNMTLAMPERIEFRLARVEPHLFEKLESVLGPGYFREYPFSSRFQLENPELLPLIRDRFPALLAVGEHDPVVTFHIRPGVRWHDGVTLSAEDVDFTYRALIDPKNTSPRAASYEAIKSLEVVDPLTARVTYKGLYSPAILDWTLELIPKHRLNAEGLAREMDRRGISGEARKDFTLRSSDYNRSPIGTGPFRFEEWKPDQFVRLARNDRYWGRPAEYRELYFRVIPDYLTMELEFQAGAIDRYLAMPHQAARYRKDSRYQVVSSLEGYYAYIAYNLRRPPFQDLRVRRALSLALDVDGIIKYVLYGEGQRSTGPYFSNTPFNDLDLKPLAYDPVRAAALLAEAGWKKGKDGILEKNGAKLRFTLVTNNANPQRKAVMVLAQQAWKKLGVDCHIQAFEWTVFIEEFVNKQNFDAMVLAWTGGDLNPDLTQIWSSTHTHPYELNYTGYASPRADDLLNRIRTEYDPEAQIRLARELHRVIAEDQPYTFLFEPLKPVVLDKRIVRVREASDGKETLEPIRAPAVGNVDQSIAEWRKTSARPRLSAQ